MVKKIAMSAAAGATMLAAAVPAFAAVNIGALNGNTAQLNSGAVINNVSSNADSGNNVNAAFIAGVQGVTTGSATAGANVQTQLNWNQVSCDCVSGDINVGIGNGNMIQANRGFVYNEVEANAETGENANIAAVAGIQGVSTGAAAAGAVVVNVVNTNMIGN